MSIDGLSRGRLRGCFTYCRWSTDTDYTYDALGRLATVTDPKQQVTKYTYNLDGSVATVVYTNAQIPTPGVTWTYDPAYSRVTTMVDGTGTTTYTYHPAGQLGAGQVATVDGPLTSDVISYSYDPLGRVLTRAIDGVPLTLTYDTLGRVEREVNALGTFDYTFDGVSGRLATVTYPNNQTSTYTYFPAAQDHRLQTIHHRYPNSATLSKFDYTYDGVRAVDDGGAARRRRADRHAVDRPPRDPSLLGGARGGQRTVPRARPGARRRAVDAARGTRRGDERIRADPERGGGAGLARAERGGGNGGRRALVPPWPARSR